MKTLNIHFLFLLLSLFCQAAAIAQLAARPGETAACVPAPDFSYYQSPCNPHTIQFSNLTADIIVISWDFGDGTTSAGVANPSVTYAQFGTYAVKLRVQGIGGCTDSVTKQIAVTAQQDSLITKADTTICKGSSVQLNSLPSLNFCWSASPGLSNPLITNPVATPTVTTTYYLNSQTIGNNLVINGDFSSGNSGFTSDYTSEFPNTSQAAYWVGNNANSWNVNFNACTEHTTGSGNMMMVNGSPVVGAKVWSQTINISPNTNYAFAVWIQSLASLNPARLRFSINGYLLGNNITAGSTACQWNRFYTTWNSGGNTTATITIVNDNTIANGNDFALDDISFSQMFLKQDSIKITVVDPPDLVPIADTSICAGEPVQLNVTGATTVAWSPATGLSNPNIRNPLATPAVTTKYLVSGYNLPGCVGTDSVTITIKPKPVISRITDTGFCAGSPGIILFATAPGATQYIWTPSTGLSSTTVSNPQASPAATTRYFVEVTGSNGCKSKDSVRVAVLPAPAVSTRSDTTICEASPIALTTVVTGATRYSWSPARDLSDSSLASPIATPTQATTYVVTVSNGYCSASDAVSLSLYPGPVITKSADTTICNQGRAQLSAGGGVSYSWMPATGLNSTSIANPVASPAAPTRYYVTVTGTNGCKRVDSINVGWIPRPFATVTPASVAVCRGQSTVLTAAGGDAYDWYAGTNILSRYTASTAVLPDAIQQYSVAVQHTFCRVSDTVRAVVIVNELPVIKASKANDIDCSNGSSILTATGGTVYSWSPGTAITGANTATPEVAPATSTTYTVQATDANGCRGSDSVWVNVSMNPATGGYYVVSAFTPNGDGKNDCFGLKFWGVIEQLDFSVFNRWGQRVFYSKDPGQCWDGTHKGLPQPAGTYVYKVKATTVCGEISRKGTITLIR